MEGPSPYQLNILPIVKKTLNENENCSKQKKSKTKKEAYGKYVSMKM